MLLVKIRNGLELTWDSLDSQERQVILYLVCYLVLVAVTALQRASRERLKRELREEMSLARGG